MKVLIVGGYNLLGYSLSFLLESKTEEFEATDTTDPKRFQNLHPDFKPDAIVKVVTSETTPPADFGEQITTLVHDYVGIPVIVYGNLPVYEIKYCLKIGVRGYLSGNARFGDLKECLRSTISGKKYLENDVLVRLMMSKNIPGDAAMSRTGYIPTEIEKKVGDLLIKGENYKSIGKILDRRPETIGKIKVRLFKKLNISHVIMLKQVW